MNNKQRKEIILKSSFPLICINVSFFQQEFCYSFTLVGIDNSTSHKLTQMTKSSTGKVIHCIFKFFNFTISPVWIKTRALPAWVLFLQTQWIKKNFTELFPYLWTRLVIHPWICFKCMFGGHLFYYISC